jgi:hypothetical protein
VRRAEFRPGEVVNSEPTFFDQPLNLVDPRRAGIIDF